MSLGSGDSKWNGRIERAIGDDLIVAEKTRGLGESWVETPGMFTVLSGSGNSYEADAGTGTCQCKDNEYRGPYCKHVLAGIFNRGCTEYLPGGKKY